MLSDVERLARNRLLDYLAFKKIPIPTGDIVHSDLNRLGFDIIDWGTLIGEIQCDCLMMLDWDQQNMSFNTLADVIQELIHGQPFEFSIDIHHAMHQDMPVEDQVQHMKTAMELIWPR